MTLPYLEDLKDELKKGLSEKEHPYRCCTLATVGLDRLARLRTVVMRDMSEDFVFSFYTDKRSKKIVHIKENNKVSLLFYHPGRNMQLKIEGLAIINRDPVVLNPIWSDLEVASRKDYTTSMAPGSTLERPGNLEYLSEENHFCMVEVHPFKIEYLKLGKHNHLRIRFSRNNNDWNGEYLVP
jgi:pyridoxine/pyridoxamine 5'-phosphate oxidase